MPYPHDTNEYYRKLQSEGTKKQWREGVHDSQVKPLEERFCNNPKCTISFKVKPYNPKKYCSKRCSVTITNTYRIRVNKFCLYCDNRLKISKRIYCSVSCQQMLNYKKYIDAWKNGFEDGNRGITTKNISKYLRRYLQEKYKNKCSTCGWNQKNPVTGIVPLEIDHIDGNSENNKEDNLRLICPNCHSLTPYFRNLNKGNGRAWRIKYLKKQSLLFDSSLETSTLLK